MCGYLSVAHTFVLVKLIFPHKANYQICEKYMKLFIIMIFVSSKKNNSLLGERIIIGQRVGNKRNKYHIFRSRCQQMSTPLDVLLKADHSLEGDVADDKADTSGCH